MRHRETTVKPYTVPEAAPDSTLVEAYWWAISKEPRLLIGLRRDDGSLYLERKHLFTHAIQPESEAS